MAIHHAVVTIYSKKFPKLETLVPNVLDYLRVVSRMQNEMVICLASLLIQDMSQVNMSDILPPSQVMVVAVTGSTINGEPLTPQELEEVLDLCSEALNLDESRSLLLRFIESRVTKLAPNVSALVGTHIAARIIGQVGGLRALANMPACNVMLVGQQKQATDGYAMSSLRHTGILYQTDLVQDSPVDLRRKVNR